MVDTVRTILSPFTKEYRVLATQSGIRQFLKSSISLKWRLTISTLKSNLVKMEADNVNAKIEDVCFNSWRKRLLTHTNVEDV